MVEADIRVMPVGEPINISVNLLNEDITISAELESDDININVDLGTEIVIGPAYPVYTGDTIVVPRRQEQILETSNKTLLDDITVRQVPDHRVINHQGGLTVSIATE